MQRSRTLAATPTGGRDGHGLVAEGLTKRFGARSAVSGASLTVDYGEVFGFLGPNGAGKTTTVRLLGTLLVPSAGSAVIAGVPLSPENGVEIRRRISLMPESPGLYPRLTVAENLEYFAGLYELPDVGERIDRTLLSFGVIHASTTLALGLGAALLLEDALGWRLVSVVFDRERLVTGVRS